VAAGAGVYLGLRDDAQEPTAANPDLGSTEAAAACRNAAQFERLVQANRPTDEVLAVLRKAEQQGKSAAAADPMWVALSGGLSSVRLGIEGNDGPTARTGIDVVRAECRRTER
jgi:hypothetical protein